MCDDLADKTPGLQGLCVAMCEAQACEAEINEWTGEVDFGPGCNPSSDELLANYNNLKTRDDPDMPCVKQMPCPCWSEEEIAEIAGPNATCIGDGETWGYLQGNGGGWQSVYVGDDPIYGGLHCKYETPADGTRVKSRADEINPFTDEQLEACALSVQNQCAAGQ